MKNLVLFLSIFLSLNLANANSELQELEEQMSNPHYGKTIRSSELHGAYEGTCYEGKDVKTETLYVGAFVNAVGSTTDLAISTMQTYGGYKLPEHLRFLLQPTTQSWDYMKDLVARGLAGTDNNLGKVGPGKDFQYLYESKVSMKTLTVSVDQYRNCELGVVCDPPLAPMCNNGYDSNGNYVYEDCIRTNDITNFKKVSDTTLISHRTAGGHKLTPVSTYCKWEKK